VDWRWAELHAPDALVAMRMAGGGLRLSETAHLRLHHGSFDTGRLAVRFGKGGHSRTVPVPHKMHGAIRRQFAKVKILPQEDLQTGEDGVCRPAAFAKQATSAARALARPWFLPAQRLTRVAATRAVRRDHGHDTDLPRAIKVAARKAGIPKRVSPHTLRHTFATPLLPAHDAIRQMQPLRGHSAVRTTMSDTQTITADLKPRQSPLDWSWEARA
jgi:site-specific recombinase XerC